MTVWRISNHLTLDGGGGLRASGRWHTRGQRVVYCAPNPASALLEVLVHTEVDFEDLPLTYKYFEIEMPESVVRETADISAVGAEWRAAVEATQNMGNEWLRSLRTALLMIPSAIVPATTNILINPAHHEIARIKIAGAHQQGVDPRLIRL